MFGGYAPETWHKSGTWYGSENAFIFGLYPRFCVYKCTGVSDNVLWCGQVNY